MKSWGRKGSEIERGEISCQEVETVRLIYPILMLCLHKGKPEDMGQVLILPQGWYRLGGKKDPSKLGGYV